VRSTVSLCAAPPGRYLADARQRQYGVDGWNLTSGTYKMDEDGYFWFQARIDDMIISSGYNNIGPRSGSGTDVP
jgi:acyl-coenzyme A synthetase/AMP-(fatty) acid ligase